VAHAVMMLTLSDVTHLAVMYADDQGERSVTSLVLRAGDLLWFVLSRQRDPGHRRHGLRRLSQTGGAGGRRRGTGRSVTLHVQGHYQSVAVPSGRVVRR